MSFTSLSPSLSLSLSHRYLTLGCILITLVTRIFIEIETGVCVYMNRRVFFVLYVHSLLKVTFAHRETTTVRLLFENYQQVQYSMNVTDE